MNNYKSFSKLKEELGGNYDFKLKATLPLKYYDCYCTKIIGNYLDYEIVEKVDSDE